MVHYRTVVAALVVSLVAACAAPPRASGPQFSPYALASPEKALLYVYRPEIESLGWGRTYYLLVNGEKVGDILYGGYFPIEVATSKVLLVSDVNTSTKPSFPLVASVAEAAANAQAATLELDLRAGKTYYVRMSPEAKFTHFIPRFTLVSKDEAEREIAKCRLLRSFDAAR